MTSAWSKEYTQRETASTLPDISTSFVFPSAEQSYDFVLEPSPVALPLVEPLQTRVVQVSCGRAHSLVLTDQEGGKRPKHAAPASIMGWWWNRDKDFVEETCCLSSVTPKFSVDGGLMHVKPFGDVHMFISNQTHRKSFYIHLEGSRHHHVNMIYHKLISVVT